MKETDKEALAERIASKLSVELIGCKVGKGTQSYVKDVVLKEIKQFEQDLRMPERDYKKGYEL